MDDADPIGEHRLLVIVPEVWGTEAGAWAVPSLPPGGAATPAVGDLVWVTFEGGDTDYPIWDAGAAPDPDAVPADGHVGRYRALVADNVDPMEEHRLNVKIPEVLGDDTTAWAKAAPDLAAAESAVPDIGTEVWIEFESGDPNYPIWVGVASNGSSNGQPGIGGHGPDLAASTDTRNPRSGGLSGSGRHPPTPA